MMRGRISDRWVTPGVIIAAIMTGGLVLAVIAAAVAYLTSRGLDFSPVLQIVAEVGAALGWLGTFVLQLVGRSTVTKVERNTGILAGLVTDVADAVTSTPETASGTTQLPAGYARHPEGRA